MFFYFTLAKELVRTPHLTATFYYHELKKKKNEEKLVR